MPDQSSSTTSSSTTQDTPHPLLQELPITFERWCALREALEKPLPAKVPTCSNGAETDKTTDIQGSGRRQKQRRSSHGKQSRNAQSSSVDETGDPDHEADDEQDVRDILVPETRKKQVLSQRHLDNLVCQYAAPDVFIHPSIVNVSVGSYQKARRVLHRS